MEGWCWHTLMVNILLLVLSLSEVSIKIKKNGNVFQAVILGLFGH